MFLLWNSFHSPQEKIKTLRQQLDENAIDLKELDVKEVSRIVINKRRYWYRRSIYELTISYDDGRPDR